MTTTLDTTIAFVVDDFAAGGGWEQGLRQAGFTGEVVGIEFDKDAVDTAEANGFLRVHGDVRTESIKTIRSLLSKHGLGARWLYLASPPCQTFSAAGGGAGRKHLDALLHAVRLVGDGYQPEDAIAIVSDEALDERSVLVLHPLNVIRTTRPTAVLLEQVKECLPIWQAYADVLRGWGYAVRTEIVKAERYGVPQSRRRAILSARLGADVAPWPTATHSEYYPRDKARRDPGVLSFVTMAEALGVDPTAEVVSNYSTGGDTANPGIRSASEPSATVTSKVNRNKWRFEPVAANEGTTPEDMAWVGERPAMTVVGSFAPDIMAAPGYRKAGDGPRQKARGSVRLTIEQALVLQSFPADYAMRGNKSAQFQIVGNAVPPLLSQAFTTAALTA